jgi:TRAP transporter 4TM/12TM fusion protein
LSSEAGDPDMNHASDDGRHWHRIALTLSLVLAALALTNVMPAFWIIPRLGPFEVEPFRAGLFALGLTVSVIEASFGRAWLRQSRARAAGGFALDAALLAVGLFACWRYYVDGLFMADNIMFYEPFHSVTTLGVCFVILVLCWRLWGAPLAIVASVALIYFFTGPYWPWIFQTGAISFVDDVAEKLWFNHDSGILGNLFSIVVTTVFPFIILGAMLEGTGAGGSLVKVSFVAMRRFRGGPAHAAVLASGIFGTVSGTAVANVVGTGVITIPMIKRRGFSPAFAGGVEATASTGGQVMPPIMGAAALVMADFVGINYLTIIVAALTPALIYYASLFIAVMLESRRLGIEADQDEGETLVVGFQDYLNLILTVVSIAVVITALVMGASPAGSAMLALMVLIPLSLLINPAVRRRPWVLILALAQGGHTLARLLMAIGAIGIVVSVLSSTGLPTNFAIVIGQGEQTLFISLLITAFACLVLGMGMPTLPAYITIVVMLGPALQKLGLEPLTAHMFVFYFGVAATITPPVAIAAYAAASIAGSRPMETAWAAVRLGLVIFVIPFAFAYNPIMLIVSEAGAVFSWGEYAFLWVRVLIAVYLLASVLVRFDIRRLSVLECLLRAGTAVALLSTAPVLEWTGLAVGSATIGLHIMRYRISQVKVA